MVFTSSLSETCKRNDKKKNNPEICKKAQINLGNLQPTINWLH
jgi:hypothetical protein